MRLLKLTTPVLIMSAFFAVISTFVSTEAKALNVVSANGFSCSATPTSNNRSIIECDGRFPGVPGIFGATGYDLVHVEYTPDNKKRYFYMSETGCLIMNAPDGSALAVDRNGSKKQFGVFTDAMNWCYTDTKSTP